MASICPHVSKERQLYSTRSKKCPNMAISPCRRPGVNWFSVHCVTVPFPFPCPSLCTSDFWCQASTGFRDGGGVSSLDVCAFDPCLQGASPYSTAHAVSVEGPATIYPSDARSAIRGPPCLVMSFDVVPLHAQEGPQVGALYWIARSYEMHRRKIQLGENFYVSALAGPCASNTLVLWRWFSHRLPWTCSIRAGVSL